MSSFRAYAAARAVGNAATESAPAPGGGIDLGLPSGPQSLRANESGKGPLRHRRDGTAELADGLVHGEVAVDGTLKSLEGPPPVGFDHGTFTFDATDLLMSAIDEDAYNARKLRLADRTREQRAVMYRSALKRRLRANVAGSRAHLLVVWRDRRLSWAQRRRLLFELWDECAEAGSASRVAAARAVRATIESFIRAQAPAGTTRGYGADELAALNRVRRSRVTFAPYSTAADVATEN